MMLRRMQFAIFFFTQPPFDTLVMGGGTSAVSKDGATSDDSAPEPIVCGTGCQSPGDILFSPAGRVPLTSASTQPGAAQEAAASPHRNVSFIDLPGSQDLTTSAPLGGASSTLYPATASRMGDKTMAQSPKKRFETQYGAYISRRERRR